MIKILKKLTFLTMSIIMLTSFSIAQDAPSWSIDKSHSSINFEIAHFFSTVNGRFNSIQGTFKFDKNNLKGSYVKITIPVKSISTDDKQRDEHLLSKDFFDATSFPNMIFESTRFEKKSGKDYVVHGKLTIKNTTKNISLPFKYLGEMDHPMMQGSIFLGLSANYKLKRNDYGVGTGNWAATMVVGDDVNIKINLELNRKK